MYFSNNRWRSVQGGWRGVLMMNLALIDPKESLAFFRDGVVRGEERDGDEGSEDDEGGGERAEADGTREEQGVWDEEWLDGGASRTWGIVWAMGLSLGG